MFNVINEGNLPARLLGLVDQDPEAVWLPRWTAVGMDPDHSGRFASIEYAEPFRPVDLQPGEFVTLFLVGRAGTCAAGPDIAHDGNGAFIGAPLIRVAFSIFGLSDTARIDPPFVVSEPQAEGCDALPEVVEP